MRLKEDETRRLMRLPADAPVSIEDAGLPLVAADRIAVGKGDGRAEEFIARYAMPAERALNQQAVMERLNNLGFEAAPKLVAMAADLSIEAAFAGLPWLAIRPQYPAAERVIDQLAALHRLEIREGLDWERDRKALVPDAEPPLHRLGFSSGERDPALAGFAAAREALGETPLGFAHRNLTSALILVGERGVTITEWGHAGQGLQLMDVASFLVTSGLEPHERRALAQRYAETTGQEPVDFANLVDLGGICWGVGFELELPRRQIQVMGDEGSMEALVTLSRRIHRCFEQAAGDHPAAETIRRALWPSYHPWHG